MTSLILGAFPKFSSTEKAFNSTIISDIDEEAWIFALLRAKYVLEIIRFIADLTKMVFSANIFWFMQNQIVLKQFVMAASTTN